MLALKFVGGVLLVAAIVVVVGLLQGVILIYRANHCMQNPVLNSDSGRNKQGCSDSQN